MRNSNKLLALALAAVLALGSTTTAFAAASSANGSEGEAAPISDTTADTAEDKKKEDASDADSEGKADDAGTADSEDKTDDSAGGDSQDEADATADTDTPAMNYSDVTNKNWYYSAVSFVTEKKLMEGMTDTTFGPSENMTRQMLAVALYRLAGSPEVTAENPFTDVASDAAYKDAVVWAYSVGVVTGTTDTTFSPDSSIQRQAIATMLARYLKADTSADGDVSAFADADAIQSYAKGAMAWAASNKLIQGDTKGNVDPRGNATRAQVATILQRFADMAEDKAPAAPAESDAAPTDTDTAAPAESDKKDDTAGATTPADEDKKDDTDTTPADEDKKDDADTTPADEDKKDDADTTPADEDKKDDADTTPADSKPATDTDAAGTDKK